MKHLIQLEATTKVFHRGKPDEVQALRGVSLGIERSDVVALTGPSGSGKTTLLGLVGCMTRPTSGRVWVDGRDVAKLPERHLTEVRRRSFGFVFQQFHLIRGISVLENVLLPLYPTSLPLSEMQRRGKENLQRLRIWERRNLRPHQLSGGEQQRVAIARALVNSPQVLIADEPTAHLDSELSRELLAILRELNDSGTTVVIATHDPRVYEDPLVRTIFSLKDGQLEGRAER